MTKLCLTLLPNFVKRKDCKLQMLMINSNECEYPLDQAIELIGIN